MTAGSDVSGGAPPRSDAAKAAARAVPEEAHLHLRFGWIVLVFFVGLGILLEGMHALKVGWYLDVPNTTRRLMWTLGHAHGTLIALLNVAFALTVRVAPMDDGRRRLASRCLIAANVIMPGGFLLGGIDTYGGDPGLGGLLTPIGAALLLVGVFVTALEIRTLRPRT